MLQADILDIQFEIGNHYEQLEEYTMNKQNGMPNNNKWTAFIRLRNPKCEYKLKSVIKHVDFTLHESYRG